MDGLSRHTRFTRPAAHIWAGRSKTTRDRQLGTPIVGALEVLYRSWPLVYIAMSTFKTAICSSEYVQRIRWVSNHSDDQLPLMTTRSTVARSPILQRLPVHEKSPTRTIIGCMRTMYIAPVLLSDSQMPSSTAPRINGTHRSIYISVPPLPLRRIYCTINTPKTSGLNTANI